jgi:uncharacterized protein (TIGR02145 family)
LFIEIYVVPLSFAHEKLFLMKTYLTTIFVAATFAFMLISCKDKPPPEIPYDGSLEAEFPAERPDVAAVQCGEKFDFGKIGFVSVQTWRIESNGVSQTWSAPVIAENCYKINFHGGDYFTEPYNIDCRTQNNKIDRARYGDFFSWCAVENYATTLCPNGWRVPTVEDFIDLDIALGGTGDDFQLNSTLVNNYIRYWGGDFGGVSYGDGTLDSKSTHAYYWSKSGADKNNGYCLILTDDGILGTGKESSKNLGFTLRCIQSSE